MFTTEFEKTALDAKSATKAVNALKHKLIRRGQTLPISSLKEFADSAAKGKMMYPGFKKGKGNLGLGPTARGDFSKLKPENLKFMRGEFHHPKAKNKIFAKGNIGQKREMLAGTPLADGYNKMNPKNKKMTNKLFLMHEGAELDYVKKLKTPTMSVGMHHDPGVILREGNMLATLPGGYGKTKKIFQGLRRQDGTAGAMEHFVPKFKYGKTRLSRHGIKRMREVLKKKGYQTIAYDDYSDQLRKAYGK